MNPLPRLPAVPTIPASRPIGRWMCHTSAMVAALLLAACTSTPLPPWPTQNARVVAPPRAMAPTDQVSLPPATTAQATAVATPEVADQTDAAVLESTAVAAHFPDPPVRYDTPGLQPNRRAWTTNAELASWLVELGNTTTARTQASRLELGSSQSGTPITALALGAAGSGNALESNGRPTVVLIAQQHGDAPASSEALLVMARELSQGLLEPMLQRINVVLLPRANPDGASALSHTLADGTDLDRDHLALQTPEARAIAQLLRTWRPAVVVDVREYPVQPLQVGDAQMLPSYDVMLQPASAPNVPDFVTKAALEWFVQPMLKSLDTERLTHEWLHTLTATAGTLTAETGNAYPDSLRNLAGLSNSVGVAVASRGIGLGHQHAQRRVHSLVVALSSVLRSTAERSGDLRQVQAYVARDIASKACQGSYTVLAGPTTSERELSLIDAASGALTQIKARWISTMTLRPALQRPRPCGYWLSAQGDAAQRLGLLGVQVMRIAEGGSVLTESFSGNQADQPGAQPLRTTTDVPAGSYFVGLNQPLAHLAEAALEPGTPFSYQSTGIVGGPGASARVINNPSLVFDEPE